ncbi:ABC transporter ATP-binding protein [Fusibacter bizertensis]
MLKIIKRLPMVKVFFAIFFLLIQIVCALYLPYITADIVNKGVVSGDNSYVLSKGALMIALSLISLVGAIVNTFIFSKISYKLGSQLRAEIYGKALSFSKFEYDKIGTSSLITRNTNDVTQVQNLVEMGLKFLILAPAMLIGGIVMTYLLNPTLALIFLATVPFLTISYLIIYFFARPLYTKMQKLLDQMNLFFREGLNGAKIIRAFSKEEIEFDKYNGVNQSYTQTSISAGTIMSFFIPVITMILSLSTVIIMWKGGKMVGDGTLAVGDIMGAISYSAQILMGFGMLTNIILAIPRGQISANRINEVIEMPLSIVQTGVVQKPKHSKLSTKMRTSLTFDHVDFRYHGADSKTLENITLEVSSGQTLAIIGSTGEGKTTLVSLISRLYDVENGAIKIEHQDIRKYDETKLRALISLTPQKSILFMGTIRSNMLMSKPNATDQEIWEALDIADATEFVSQLPQGLDSVIDKNGGNFSGGQKQRLSIARSILKDAKIYIFDDTFSALDFKTDLKIRKAIRRKLKDAITIIVAQRISTIMDADLIALIDGGKLSGLGTHDDLKAGNVIYQEIIESQFYKEAI